MTTSLQENELKDLFTKLPIAEGLPKKDPDLRLINFDIFKRIVDKTSEIAYTKGKVEAFKDLETMIDNLGK